MKTLINTTLVCVLLLLATNMNSSNPLRLGVKAGLNLSDYAGDMEDNSIKVGYTAGITVDYQISNGFFVLSGLEVSSKGTRRKDKMPEIANTHMVKQNWNPVYLQVPLHVGYTVEAAEDMLILLHLGPFVSYGVGGKMTQETYTNDGKTKTKVDIFGSDGLLKRWDVGLGLGAGFEFRDIGINFGYDLGFLKAHKSKDFTLRNNTAHITFAYRFQ